MKLNTSNVIATYECPLTSEIIEDVFGPHYNISKSEKSNILYKINVNYPDEKTEVLFSKTGYEIHAPLDYISLTHGHIYRLLYRNNIVSTTPSLLRVDKIEISIEPPINHNNMSTYPRTNDDVLEPPYHYLVDNTLVKTLDSPFSRGIIIPTTEYLNVQSSRNLVDEIKESLQKNTPMSVNSNN